MQNVKDFLTVKVKITDTEVFNEFIEKVKDIIGQQQEEIEKLKNELKIYRGEVIIGVDMASGKDHSNIPESPEPPKNRWIQDGATVFCKKCGSSLIREKWWHLKRTVCPNMCELRNPEWPRR